MDDREWVGDNGNSPGLGNDDALARHVRSHDGSEAGLAVLGRRDSAKCLQVSQCKLNICARLLTDATPAAKRKTLAD